MGVARLAGGLAICLVAGLVAWSSPATAFILPSDLAVGPGSEWIYRSNLGETHVRMLEKTHVAPSLDRYRWDMRVAGLRYIEDLELTPERLAVARRLLDGFGIVRKTFTFVDRELVVELPLEVGNTWTWSGSVKVGERIGVATAQGEVLSEETITVPAGTFDVYHIHLRRDDTFGTLQIIDLWFDPETGPIKAIGDIRWRGVIGFVQKLVGLEQFRVELLDYSIVPPKTALRP